MRSGSGSSSWARESNPGLGNGARLDVDGAASAVWALRPSYSFRAQMTSSPFIAGSSYTAASALEFIARHR